MNRGLITVISYVVAWEIASNRFELQEFFEKAGCCEYIYFAHTNFFYSFPDFSKQWKGKASEFHRVDIACHLCKEKPERNLAGIGNICLLNNGAAEDLHIMGRFLPGSGPIKSKRTRMICLCSKCAKQYFLYGRKVTMQLELNLF